MAEFASRPGLAVLNPLGKDTNQDFADGPGIPEDHLHPPVNYHAYAACTNGAFYRDAQLAARHRSVLLLLRGNFNVGRRALSVLKAKGCFVAISFKESGTEQTSRQLGRAHRFQQFRELANKADLCCSSTEDLVPLYSSVSRHVVHIPTPYPIEFGSWDFSKPVGERRGIFIGTREFRVASRNHLLVLCAARSFSVPITVINSEGRFGSKLLSALKFPQDQLRVELPRSYPEFLRLIAEHRIVLQFDQSAVPGQIAGDALLCRVPTVGGNGAVEKVAFPDLNSHKKNPSELVDLARQLIQDESYYARQVAALESIPALHLSFSNIRKVLLSNFPGLQ